MKTVGLFIDFVAEVGGMGRETVIYVSAWFVVILVAVGLALAVKHMGD